MIGQGKPIHHFTMKDEYGNELDEGHHLIFIDASYAKDWPLKDLMDDFKQPDPNKMKYNILKERAMHFKEEEDGIMYVTPNIREMVLEMHKDEIDRQVRIQVQKKIQEQIQQQVQQQVQEQVQQEIKKQRMETLKQRKETIKRFLDKNFSVEFIAEVLQAPPSEIEQVKEEMEKRHIS